jgi:hypothetical protein
MSLRSLSIAAQRLGAYLVERIREVQGARERYRARFVIREARGLKLFREWLSPEQRAEFDAKGFLDVIGCDSGKRYRIHYGATTNVHEIGDDGLPLMGWCFLPEGPLIAGDVMLAQKVALENHECSALAVAHRFPTNLRRTRRLVPGRQSARNRKRHRKPSRKTSND